MFTSRRTPLSNFADSAGLQVLRDVEIAYVGKIPTDLEARAVPAAKPEHLEYAKGFDGIAAFIVPPNLAELVPTQFGLAIADAPQAAVARIQETLSTIENFQWEGFETRIDPTAVIEPGAYVAARDVTIGSQTYVGPNAVILPRSIIGNHCYIGAGTVVGMEAFDHMAGSTPTRILPQSGGVKIEDHVTIQAKCTIVRATFGGFTTLGRETMLDCQVHVAHDCKIGKRVKLTACTEISGRAEIGDDCFLGPNCSISNGVKLGKCVHVTIGSVVVRDVTDGERVTGNFALPHQKWLNFIRTFR
jgi:UDP-3-O-[3-hydroxymyristoyl] glucosamine N-acyltransferase